MILSPSFAVQTLGWHITAFLTMFFEICLSPSFIAPI